MKFNFLQRQTSRREMLRDSATLAQAPFWRPLFPATYAAPTPSTRARATTHLPARRPAREYACPVSTQFLRSKRKSLLTMSLCSWPRRNRGSPQRPRRPVAWTLSCFQLGHGSKALDGLATLREIRPRHPLAFAIPITTRICTSAGSHGPCPEHTKKRHVRAADCRFVTEERRRARRACHFDPVTLRRPCRSRPFANQSPVASQMRILALQLFCLRHTIGIYFIFKRQT